jgi:hypothetical protein
MLLDGLEPFEIRRARLLALQAERDAAEKERKRLASKAQAARWRRDNPDKARAIVKAYRERNPKLASERSKTWARSENGRASGRQRRYRKYGLTEAAFVEKLCAQGSCCTICLTDAPGGKGWHTGRVRDILCAKCNLLLGHANDDPEILAAAIRYLERHS